MSVNAEFNDSNEEVRITITEHFDLSSHKEFGQVIKSAKGKEAYKYTIDLSTVKDMDSSALGMLLLLRDVLGGGKSNIDIIKCQEDVKEILATANFRTFFNIS